MGDARAAARDFVNERYPLARVAFLGGSAATDAATSTSDLDVLVLLDDAQGEVSFVETTTHQGWLVEAFVYTPAAAARWIQKGRDERRPVLDALAATGAPLTDNQATQAWADQARDVLAAGPSVADPADVDLRRYALSALVDDLDGCGRADEAFVLMATAFREAAELTLLVQRRWLGSGKWLARNLRSADDHGLGVWAAEDRSPGGLAVICRAVLDAAGGYLQDGFVRGQRPERLARTVDGPTARSL